MDITRSSSSSGRKPEVPGLLFGDLLYTSQPGRQNEADARLVLRMAMTGETLEEVTDNLKKTYGPLMNLNTLMKLMASKERNGTTLFYSELPENGLNNPTDTIETGFKSRGFASTGFRRSIRRRYHPMVKEIIGSKSIRDYWNVACRCVGRMFNRKRKNQMMFACLSNSDVSMETRPSNEVSPVEIQPAENIMEAVPLEIALRLMMDSSDKYNLVVNKGDMLEKADALKTPVFPARGVELSIDTNKGPVTFIPMFFSRREINKTFGIIRDFLRHLWLNDRAQRRLDVCNRFVHSIASWTGMDAVLSDQRPTTRNALEEPEEDDPFGDGEPPEIKEFIEELGESNPVLIPKSTPFLLGLPLMLLLGCLTLSTTLWRDASYLFDVLMLNTPLDDEVYNRRLDCLHTLQLLLSGIWQIAQLPRRNLALTMIVDKTLHSGPFPNWRKLRKTSTDTVLNTVIEVDQRINGNGTQGTKTTTRRHRTVDLKFCFNLNTAFNNKLGDVMPKPINKATTLGICLIGELGLHGLQARVPSLGFTNVAYIQDGIPWAVRSTSPKRK